MQDGEWIAYHPSAQAGATCHNKLCESLNTHEAGAQQKTDSGRLVCANWKVVKIAVSRTGRVITDIDWDNPSAFGVYPTKAETIDDQIMAMRGVFTPAQSESESGPVVEGAVAVASSPTKVNEVAPVSENAEDVKSSKQKEGPVLQMSPAPEPAQSGCCCVVS